MIDTSIQPMPRSGQNPELEPIPGPRDLNVPPAGDMPVRPPPRGPTQRMLDMIPYTNSLKYSPQIVERAKTLYGLEENVQKQIEDRAQKDFERRYDLWKERKIKEEQRTYDLPETEVKNMQGRIELKKGQLAIERDPLERAKLMNDIAEGEQKIKAGKAPETVEIDGKRFIWDQTAGKYVDALPKIAPEEIKLPAEAQKTWELYQMGKFATRGMGDARILASGPQRVIGSIPIFGNALVKEAYQVEMGKASAWVQAFLRHESGATIRPEESKSTSLTTFRFTETPKNRLLRNWRAAKTASRLPMSRSA
jgi:hypothetical protein